MVATQRPHHEEIPNLKLHTHSTPSSLAGQSRCWNCEEAVHRLSDTCPYCKKSLQVFHISPEDKVEAALYAPLESTQHIRQQGVRQQGELHQTHGELHQTIDQPASVVPTLLAALALSCSGILLLLALFILLFGDGVSFTLEWPQESWKTFSALGLVLLVLGSYFLSKITSDHVEST